MYLIILYHCKFFPGLELPLSQKSGPSETTQSASGGQHHTRHQSSKSRKRFFRTLKDGDDKKKAEKDDKSESPAKDIPVKVTLPNSTESLAGMMKDFTKFLEDTKGK